MKSVRTTIGQGGRIVIPAEYRKALGICEGDTVIVALDDGEVRVFTIDEWIRWAQELVRKYIPPGRSLVDELIAERRAEAARE